jgi:hypothetical protein
MTWRLFLRLCLWGGLLLGGLVGPAGAKVDVATRLLDKSLADHGVPGWIEIPDAGVANSGEVSLGLRRTEASMNLSLLGLLEGGIYFDAGLLAQSFETYQNLSSWDRVRANVPSFSADVFRGQAKLKLLDQDWAGLGLAAGIEEQDPYVVAEKYFVELSRVTVVAGWGRGRFNQGFGGFSKAIMPGAEVIFEFDGTGINTGLKMLLARNLVLAIAIQDVNTLGEIKSLGDVIGNHFLFGITYVERAW